TRLREDAAQGRQMKRSSRVGMKREAVIDPSLEKTLLSLHAATDSVRDFGSMPSAQATMGARATPYCSANRLQGRTGASSAIAAFASDASFETTRFSRRGTAAFSHRVRGFAPSGCSAYRFAASCPAH